MTPSEQLHIEPRNRGFTLLELSIVLTIIALITGMAIDAGVSAIATARITATQQKMKPIDAALLAFRNANDRLPCPGDLTIAPGATNYGIEGATPGICTGGTPAANHSAAGATNTWATGAEGSLPAITLGLSPDFMIDGWGNEFRYTVDTSMTALGAFPKVNIGCTNGAITVNDANGSARSTGSIYALISHGANGHGAYPRNGGSTLVNAGSINTAEQTNCHCNSSASATAYAPTYVQEQSPTLDPTNSLDNYDDLITYKERWQMQTAWDATGSCASLYICDDANHVIRKVTMSTGIITTVAGTGAWGDTGDGGPALAAAIEWPSMVAVDSNQNVYWADYNQNVVRKVTASTGIISRIAGNNTAGFTGDGGLATSAELNSPDAVAVDGKGNVYILDSNNSRIRKVAASTGIITTVAGTGSTSYSGDGGLATSAGLADATAISTDKSGNFYISDAGAARLRKVTVATGIITTVAGNGTGGFSGDGGAATSAELSWFGYVAFDSSGNMYIADSNNYRVRKVTTSTGIITTYAGNGISGYTGDGGAATSAEITSIGTITLDTNNNLYIADWQNNVVRKVATATGIITTYAGNGTAGYTGDGGAATGAELSQPQGVAIGISR